MERDERLFIDGIEQRVRKFIRRNIWDGIDEGRLTAWLQQFEARDCELLGACLLDSFIFRSRTQVEALLKAALISHEMTGDHGDSDNFIIESLGSRSVDPLIRLVPVIRFDQPPTKSGCYVLRRLAKSLKICDKWMIWPQRLIDEPETLSTIILVDDFCGSGDQFKKFIKLTNFKEVLSARPNCRVIYITVAAHRHGIESIKQEFPMVEFIAGEILGEEHHFFTGSMLDRIKVDGIANRLKSDYDRIAVDVGLGGSLGFYGYQDQGLTYAFDHGAPNNTLPIFWFENTKWTSLVNR